MEVNSSIELLSKATVVKETEYAGDAYSMIDDGFILVGICPNPFGSEESFKYSLIHTTDVNKLNYVVKSRWGI